MTLQFVQADATRDRDLLTRFNVDYLDLVADGVQRRFGRSLADILGQSIPDYVESTLQKMCEPAPPIGVYYITYDGQAAVGMGGLRRVREGVGEIKRIYVPKVSRGAGFGATIVRRLMADARNFGYRELVLDSGPFLVSAHRLYEAAGFTDIQPYSEAEVPTALHHDWRFMRCKLE